MTELEIKVVKALQEDLPLDPRPFVVVAARIGLTEDELLAVARDLRERGVIRRFGAAVRHRRLGYRANGMSVWNVPAERLDEVGRLLAGYEQVSHCYVRPRFDDFAYNLYAMMHAADRGAVEALAADVAEASGISDYRLLFSQRELKKSSMRFFTEEEDAVSDPSA